MPGGTFIRGILFRLCGRLPCRIVVGPDGVPYLERYFLFRVPGPRGRCLIQAYLHRFVSSDPDRGLHNHPWPWPAAVVLTGGYEDERLIDIDERGAVTRRRRIAPGSISGLRGATFHRVILPEPVWEEGLGDLDLRCPESWSLFLHGPHGKSWGFLRKVCVGIEGALRVWPAKQQTAGAPWWHAAPRGREHPDRVPQNCVRIGGAKGPKMRRAGTMA